MFFFVFDKLQLFDYRCVVFPQVDFGCCCDLSVYWVEDLFAGISRTTTSLTPFHGTFQAGPNHTTAPAKDVTRAC